MPKPMYVKETSWGYGVFVYNEMVFEAQTEEEAYTYLIILKEKGEAA